MSYTVGLARFFAVITLFSTPALALIGYGIPMYKPVCAFACRDNVFQLTLSCTEESHHAGGSHGHHSTGPTTPECRASDTSYLTTLAWCMKTKCVGAYASEDWKLEKYWQEKATGDPAVKAKWSYGETLSMIKGVPDRVLDTGEEGPSVLNFTAVVNQEKWDLFRTTKETFEYGETMHSRYGIILLVVGFAIPIFLSFSAEQLPVISPTIHRLKPYLVYPTIIGNYHIQQLPYYLGNAPTLGQWLFIATYTILNIILSAVSYKVSLPNTIFADRWSHVIGLVAARTGVIAFALAPLTLLFAGRNNILLYLTNWSYSTYILLHRWIARIFTLQVIAHSITELAYYWQDHAVESKQPYWIWGIVATLACCIMMVISVLWFRRLSYEIFLVVHIILAVIVLVGSWYHVEELFSKKWGYELWLYACFAVWGLDRLLRLFWVAKAGVQKARVTDVTDEIVRLDIPNLEYDSKPGMHAYVYFPTLKPYAPWENHPFSIIPASAFQSSNPKMTTTVAKQQTSSPEHLGTFDEKTSTATTEITPVKPVSTSSNTSASHDIEKNPTTTVTTSSPFTTTSNTGITLYIRKEKGITALLRAGTIPVLLEGPYRSPISSLLRCERLIIITGGIGITGGIPLATHGNHVNVKLYWSVKQGNERLVDDLSPVLENLHEKEVRVGERFDVAEVLSVECKGQKKIGVLACGPGALCDDVRRAVVLEGRKGARIELEVEAYSW